MKASRGMGAIRPELTKPRKAKYAEGGMTLGEPVLMYAKGGGLYDNIHAKRKRIAAGSGEKMRKPGAAGAPTATAFKQSKLTAK